MTEPYRSNPWPGPWRPGSRWEHRRVDDSGTVDIVDKVVERSHSIFNRMRKPCPFPPLKLDGARQQVILPQRVVLKVVRR